MTNLSINTLLKIYLPSGHPRCLFVYLMGTESEKCSIASLAHQWMLCSEWVPSEWESKQLIKTSQVIHTTPESRPSINVLWIEKLHVCKKQINHYDVFKVKLLLLAKIQY